MHAVGDQTAYLAAAKNAGMSAEEQAGVVDPIVANPGGGQDHAGMRWREETARHQAGQGQVSRYRVITYFGGDEVPVFLLTVFPKNMKSNLTKVEQNAFAKATKTLVDSLGGKHG
jgi:hypothetical protein